MMLSDNCIKDTSSNKPSKLNLSSKFLECEDFLGSGDVDRVLSHFNREIKLCEDIIKRPKRSLGNIRSEVGEVQDIFRAKEPNHVESSTDACEEDCKEYAEVFVIILKTIFLPIVFALRKSVSTTSKINSFVCNWIGFLTKYNKEMKAQKSSEIKELADDDRSGRWLHAVKMSFKKIRFIDMLIWISLALLKFICIVSNIFLIAFKLLTYKVPVPKCLLQKL